jgi:hypothetical protein
MDHHSPDILPAVELPNIPPSPENGFKPAETVGPVAANEILSAKAIEQGISPVGQAPASAAIPSVPHQTQSSQLASAAVTQSVPPVGMPLIAEDTDLIEKEWVDKAKEIVERTKNDPHLQNQEMSKIKADYLKKRYNKEIKVTED